MLIHIQPQANFYHKLPSLGSVYVTDVGKHEASKQASCLMMKQPFIPFPLCHQKFLGLFESRALKFSFQPFFENYFSNFCFFKKTKTHFDHHSPFNFSNNLPFFLNSILKCYVTHLKTNPPHCHEEALSLAIGVHNNVWLV